MAPGPKLDWGAVREMNVATERTKREERFLLMNYEPRLKQMCGYEPLPVRCASANSLPPWNQPLLVERRLAELRGSGGSVGSLRPILTRESSHHSILGITPAKPRDTNDWVTTSQLQARGCSPLLLRPAPATTATQAEWPRWAKVDAGLPSTRASKESDVQLVGAAVLVAEAPLPKQTSTKPLSAVLPNRQCSRQPTPEELSRLLQRYIPPYARGHRRFGAHQKSFEIVNPLSMSSSNFVRTR